LRFPTIKYRKTSLNPPVSFAQDLKQHRDKFKLLN